MPQVRSPPSQHLKGTKDGVGSVGGLVCRDVIRADVVSKRSFVNGGAKAGQWAAQNQATRWNAVHDGGSGMSASARALSR